MQLRESKVISSKALYANLAVTECSGTKSDEHITSSCSGTYITHVVDADIWPVNDQEPSAEVHLTAQHNVLTDEQQPTDQFEPSYETCLLEKLNFKKKGFTIAALKNKIRKLTENSVTTKFAKPSILGKPVLQPLRNQSIVRQPTAFRSEQPKFSRPRFTSQVDMNNILSKPVTPHYLPKVRKSIFVNPNHVISCGSSRNSSKESYGLNDMAHNYYLEEAKKKTQDKIMNLKPSKCVFNGNHDDCITKFLKEVNYRAKVQFLKSRNNIKPTKRIPNVNKNERWISKGYRFSPNKSSAVHEKPNTPRSCLRWKPTGRIFKTAGLRWIPTGKMFIDCTTKVDSKPLNGSNNDITKPYECDQTLNVSAVQASLFNDKMGPADNTSGLAPQRKERWRIMNKMWSIRFNWSSMYMKWSSAPTQISSGLVPKPPSPTPIVPLTKNEWDTLFCLMFDEYFNPSLSVTQLVLVAAVQEPVVSNNTPSSTRIDQDTPSISTSQTIKEAQSHVIPTSVEEDDHGIKVAHMDNDL
uniref:Uncharacterized protein n=1 Tax=Tanacetum cinerariifolium TaxID=118510 RepID=A0A6L2M121_TANCI|nr:hypothetical protein [Tanacetum cinerariifolium]